MDKIDENDSRERNSCKIETNWPLDHNVNQNSNSTLLYIAVEYLKDKNIIETTQSSSNYQQNVDTIDPNMNSISRYNPMYNETTNYNNPIVLVSSNNAEGHDAILVKNENNPMNVLPILSNTEMSNNHFLHLVNSGIVNGDPDITIDSLDNSGIVNKDQEVHVLITDQSTGISYSVSSQELLVEDQQLLEALTPSPLGLDTDFFTIDESTLKNNLPDLIDTTSTNQNVDDNIVSNFISNLTSEEIDEKDDDYVKLRRRISTDNLEDSEDRLLSRVYNIIDKSVPTRARATLPETYLKITKIEEEWAVFAKKCIRKRTQFGPVQGVLKKREEVNLEHNKLELLVVDDDDEKILGLDISSEDESNWMRFIRRAETYEEQNLVVSQHEKNLYFTVIRNILPRQELKVGYSFLYANRHNLTILEKRAEEQWPCFECTEQFSSSQDLQNHLDLHDVKDKMTIGKEKTKSATSKQRRFLKRKPKISKSPTVIEASQCRICQQVFNPPKFGVMKNHLLTKHDVVANETVEEHFFIVKNFKCEKCFIVFNSESLYKIHTIQHSLDNMETENDEKTDETDDHICPACSRKFSSKNQLVLHVSVHKLPKYKMIPERLQCPVCHTWYPSVERLQKHMLSHGPDETKPFQCQQCNKRFMKNSALICHIRTHNLGDNFYECPICKDRFGMVKKLRIHVQKHCVNNTYTCPYCNKKYRAYNIIRKHIRAFHTNQKHTCQHCSKVFPTVDKLKMHLLRHSDKREFLCADCGIQFKRKDKLNEHCKRRHSEERENNVPKIKTIISKEKKEAKSNNLSNKVEPTDFHRFIYKCHPCLIGFKRRGMLVNHLAKRHPDISLDSVPELNLPILRATKDYYCQYCDKVYKSSSKRKVHILKNHPGAALPISNRSKQVTYQDVNGLPNPTFSQTVGSVTTQPQNCKWCHKQYASRAKLLQHQRKEHVNLLEKNQSDNNKPSCDEGKIDETIKCQNVAEEENLSFYSTDEFMVSKSVIEEFVNDHESEDHYCHLVNVAENDVFQQADQLNLPNSHLYRLLTNTNSMVPPR